MKKTIAALVAVGALGVGLAGCTTQADTVSDNLSKDADSFKITRLITFNNDITDKYLFSIEGLCSLGNTDTGNTRTVTCKIGEDKYVKEIFTMGDNTSIVSIQTEPTASDPYHYEVIFRPETIIPDIDVQTSK